jgi:hypothetical protein
LSDAGKGCWPSIGELVEDTGMCERSITTHLHKAAEAGLLQARRERNPKGHLGPYKFHPCFPKNMEFQQDIPASEGGVAGPGEPGALDAPRDASLGALGSEPRRTKCATSNISNNKISKRESAPALSSLEADWSIPEDWRAWATRESPEHAHMIDGEAKKFKAHWRNAEKADWEGEWQKWFLRTCERPPSRPPAPAASGPGGGHAVRDTSESLKDYTARMIREGKYKPGAAGVAP